MRSLSLLFSLLLSIGLFAQYGSFNADAVKKAKAHTTIVVLDDASSAYNTALMDAIKADWKFSGGYEFVKVRKGHNLLYYTQPMTFPYLMK